MFIPMMDDTFLYFLQTCNVPCPSHHCLKFDPSQSSHEISTIFLGYNEKHGTFPLLLSICTEGIQLPKSLAAKYLENPNQNRQKVEHLQLFNYFTIFLNFYWPFLSSILHFWEASWTSPGGHRIQL